MKQRKQGRKTSMDLASPALDRRGTGSWRRLDARGWRKGRRRACYTGGKLEHEPAMASGGGDGARWSYPYLAGGGGGNEREKGKP